MFLQLLVLVTSISLPIFKCGGFQALQAGDIAESGDPIWLCSVRTVP
jgi:hypothetical protein